jgi:hypothetical protein
MGFQKIETNRRYVKYTQCKKGDVLVKNGTYVKSEENKMYGGLNHLFREEEDGVITVLNKSGKLDWLIQTHLQPGSKCRITYQGKSVVSKGKFAGRDANDFSLEVDEGAFDSAVAATTTATKGKATELDDISL